MLIGIAAVIVAILLVILLPAHSSGGPSVTPATTAAWRAWLARLNPHLAGFYRDYAVTGSSLTGGDRSSARAEFQRLSRDAASFMGLANSVDPAVNSALTTFAGNVGNLSASGLRRWPSIDVPAFERAVRAYERSVSELTRTITAASRRYSG